MKKLLSLAATVIALSFASNAFPIDCKKATERGYKLEDSESSGNSRAVFYTWTDIAERCTGVDQATAQFHLGEYYEGRHNSGAQDFAQAVYWYTKAAENPNAVLDDMTAQFRLGIIYYEGRPGVPEDDDKAHYLWRRSAAKGYVASQKALQQAFGGQ